LLGTLCCPIRWAIQLCEDTMLDELMQTGEQEMERIQRLRGYL